MPDSPSAHRELLGAGSLAGQAVALASLVTLFAFIGPFGTYDSMGPLERLGYWTVAMGANWLVCGGVMTTALRLVRDRPPRTRMLMVAGTALVAAFPGTGVVFTAEALFRPGYSDESSLPIIYVSVAVLMLAIGSTVVAVLAWRRRDSERTEAAANGDGDGDGEAGGKAADRPSSRFLDRLPPELGRDLVHLRMADHYVEAFTTAGSTLVLMRFADAIAELDGADGLRVHRSHWVARGHVVGTARRNGRQVLRLTGGREVPVSRGYLADVRAAGLL